MLTEKEISDVMVESLRQAISEGIRKAIISIRQEILNSINASFDEYKNVLKSTIQQILKNSIDGLEHIDKISQEYWQVMLESEWFPYAGWIANIELLKKVGEVISTSRGNSKRRKSRINKLIIEYYSPQRVKEIKNGWRSSNLEPYIKKILCQAIDAHLRGEYALTVTCLATMWEGLIRYKTNVTGRRQSKKTVNDLKILIKENNYEEDFWEYIEKFIFSQVNTNDDVKEGVPNRNGVAHSKYNKYPNKKASLNAILLTDFIIGLIPKKLEK